MTLRLQTNHLVPIERLGKRVELSAALPDGSRRSLLRIERWDFKWQDVYRYASPVLLPRGTSVTLRWTYDNTSSNPRWSG